MNQYETMHQGGQRRCKGGGGGVQLAGILSGKGLKAIRNLTAKLEDFNTVKARVLRSYHVHCQAYKNKFFFSNV